MMIVLMMCLEEKKNSALRKASSRVWPGLAYWSRLVVRWFDNIELEKNEQLKNLRKIVKIFKNFDEFYYEMYSETFINYHLIVMSLFDKISSNLIVILIKFEQKILKLTKLYDWETAILSLVIEHHTHVAILKIIE
jgi:hypothetical protein